MVDPILSCRTAFLNPQCIQTDLITLKEAIHDMRTVIRLAMPQDPYNLPICFAVIGGYCQELCDCMDALFSYCEELLSTEEQDSPLNPRPFNVEIL